MRTSGDQCQIAGPQRIQRRMWPGSPGSLATACDAPCAAWHGETRGKRATGRTRSFACGLRMTGGVGRHRTPEWLVTRCVDGARDKGARADRAVRPQAGRPGREDVGTTASRAGYLADAKQSRSTNTTEAPLPRIGRGVGVRAFSAHTERRSARVRVWRLPRGSCRVAFRWRGYRSSRCCG